MPGGRPTKYKPEYAEQAGKLALLGIKDEEIADVLGVSNATIYNWQNKNPDFLEAIKQGKTLSDAHIATRLFNRANGLTVKEKSKRTSADGSEVLTETTKELPPDTGAAIFWLKNRQPQLWRDNKGIVEDALAVLLTGIMDTSRGLPSQQAIEGEIEQKDG